MYKLEDQPGDRLACLEATDEKKNPVEYARWNGEAYLIKEKIRATGSLLWVTIHEENPELLAIKHLGIRKDWKIVSSPNKISIEDIVSGVLKILMRKNQNRLHREIIDTFFETKPRNARLFVYLTLTIFLIFVLLLKPSLRFVPNSTMPSFAA